jgi:hypothetical protein
MYLNIPSPYGAGNFNTGIEEIGAGITVIFSRVNHNNLISFFIKEIINIIQTVFPQVMKKLLFHVQHW